VLLTGGALVADAVMPLTRQQTLTSSYRLIAYRKRGYATTDGRSQIVEGVTLADYAGDAAALLENLGVSRAHVVGHSSGGMISMQLAHDRPDLVGSLVLLEPPLASPEAFAQMEEHVLRPALDLYAAGDHEAAVELFLNAVAGPDWRIQMDAALPGGAGEAIAGADAFFGQELPAIGAWRFGPTEAATIEVPVLSVVGSASDPFALQSRTILHEWFNDVEDYDLMGANHMMQLVDAAGLAGGLAEFFARHSL
jgi:pimeloyl-ACP methyl ester carboxylesterase